MSYLFHGAISDCSDCKCISNNPVNSECYSSRTAQNVFQSIFLVQKPFFFWALLELLVFHSATSHHVLTTLLPEGKRCGEGKERKFILLYLVWTIHLNNIVYFLWMSTHFFFLALPLDKAVLTFRGMGKSQFHRAYNPSTAGHAVFSFHISVSSQLLEPSQRKDIFVPGVFCQGKPGYSKFLFLS